MSRRPRSNETAASLGEDRLVALLTADLPQTDRTLTGPGDDCAVLKGPGSRSTLLKTDCLVESIHFTRDADAARVGWKALCRVISDMAAMGGSPQEMLVTVALPGGTPVRWVQRLYAGMARAARRYGAGIAGGETSSLPDGAPIVISVAGTGECRHRPVLRSTAKPGDVICVTGRLGGSLAGWHLDFTPRVEAAAWLMEHARPRAMMDLSDGLARDLPRMADASGCGFTLRLAAVPCHARTAHLGSRRARLEAAVGDGEDYELLLTFPAAQWPGIQQKWRTAFPRLPLTAIGTMEEDSAQRTPLQGGWVHF